MNRTARLLYLEDNPRDVQLARDLLETSGLTFDLSHASDQNGYQAALAGPRFDLILSDFNLPQFDGMTALEMAKSLQPGVPFILISGTVGEEQAVDFMLRGTTDYVMKERLARLVPAVRRALAEAEEQRLRHQAEEALRVSEAQVRQTQKLEAIGQLAGGIAHDFNNILAAIMMHLGLLRMYESLDETVRESLKELEVEARRAASLTRQLLMFSRRSVLDVRPMDLNEVIANLLKMLNRLIGEPVDLRFRPGADLPVVMADSGSMEQVVMNLVVNARDAMQKGGRITISTRLSELDEKDAQVSVDRRPGRFVCLEVADTGCGMDEATRKRIFEPFFTTKEAGMGTGLGLATVHGIVKQHQGWVEVESQLEAGTTFTVFLPAGSEMAVSNVETGEVEPLLGGRETILLVEDEQKVRTAVGQTLRSLGYQVLEASNGQQAMQLWQTHGAQVDLLLTDMVMPEGMTGLELAERLLEMRPGLRVIISSGYSNEIVESGIPRQQGVFYLPKPYDTRTLAGLLRQCMDRGKADASAEG